MGSAHGADSVLGDSEREADSVLVDRSPGGTGCVHWGNESLVGHGGVAVERVLVDNAAVGYRMDAGSWGHLDNGGHK